MIQLQSPSTSTTQYAREYQSDEGLQGYLLIECQDYPVQSPKLPRAPHVGHHLHSKKSYLVGKGLSPDCLRSVANLTAMLRYTLQIHIVLTRWDTRQGGGFEKVEESSDNSEKSAE